MAAEILDIFLKKLRAVRAELPTVQSRLAQLEAEELLIVRSLGLIGLEIPDSQDEIDVAALKETVREPLIDFEKAVRNL